MITPYKNEKTLFALACVLSTLVWLLLLGITVGLILIYALLIFLIYLFAQSGFISHLKGTGVLITAEQFPDLHQRLLACCQRTGVEQVPDAYVLRTDFFNALATRFLGRNFIVLFADVLDALEERPGAINFYIGHELGHIHRKHLLWGWFIMPASLLPLIGAGLRRAEEYTCDRYGTACCDTEEDVRAAISAIAAGNTRWKSVNVDAYLQQIAVTDGFWMSFNELTSDYPWLTKRLATALAYRRGEEFVAPRRHWLAKAFACFIPRLGFGGGSGLLISIAMLGIIAAIALPAYEDYTVRAKLAEALVEAGSVRQQLEDYYRQRNAWPEPYLSNIGYATDDPIAGVSGEYSIDIYPDGLIGIDISELLRGSGNYLVLEPVVDSGQLSWICYGQNVDPRYLPSTCQPPAD